MHQYDIVTSACTSPTRRGVVEAVRGISFYMDRGECVALVGESGCGQIRDGPLPHGSDGGHRRTLSVGSQILCHGENILDYSKKQWQSYRGRDAAMIFQDAMTSLNPTMQIGHQIAECYRFHQKIGQRRRWRRRRRCWRWWASLTRAALRRYPHEVLRRYAPAR